MKIALKAKYLVYGLDKPDRAGGPRGNGSYSARTGNTHSHSRRMQKGSQHPIGMTGRTLAIRKPR